MNVNLRPDMIRQSGMPQPPMLGLPNGQFMQSTPQGVQQQSMGLPPNAGPPMGMLSGGPQTGNPSMQGQRYPLQMQQGGLHPQQQPRQIMIRQGQPGQHMGQVPGNATMGGMPHTMGFPNTAMQQGMRRVASQGQMNPAMSGMPQAMNGNMSMAMNPQPGMPIRPIRVPTGPIPGDMSMVMNRSTSNPTIHQNVVRPGMQLMGSLSQPPSLGQAALPGGIPSQHPNSFQTSMPMSHQTAQASSPPRPGSHPQSHTPNLTMTGPSHPPGNRPQMTTGDSQMSFIGFNNNTFQPGPSNSNRMAPFVPSSTPPNQITDMSQSLANTPGGTPRSNFHLTPAQQFEQMQQSSGDVPPPPYSVSAPPGMPERPPSQLNPHMPQLPQSMGSPHHPPDMINSFPPRPPSTQTRPSSQSGTSHPPPHLGQPQPPNPGLPPPNRAVQPPQQNTPQNSIPIQSSGSTQPLPIAPRPPPPLTSDPTPPAAESTSSSQPTNDDTSAVPRPVVPVSQPTLQPPPANVVTYAVGQGQGLIRLLQFSGNLSSENELKLQLSWWNDLIKEYFTPRAIMRFTLWKENQRNEAKPFEIGVPILPRFFLATTQAGVKSMTLTLDGARERTWERGHAVVECVQAVWTYKYTNGYTVTLRGPLTVHVLIAATQPPGTLLSAQNPTGGFVLKFDDFQFDAHLHDKYLSLDAIIGKRMHEPQKPPRVTNTPTPGGVGTPGGSQQAEEENWRDPNWLIEHAVIPAEPVNAFGIPQATMRCLELAESVMSMADLISFSKESELGPLEALQQYAERLRQTPGYVVPPHMMLNGVTGGTSVNGSSPFVPFPNGNGIPTASPAITLYSSVPSSVTNPSSAQLVNSAMSSPQNAPPSANNSPRKQHKTIPQPQPQPSTAANSSTPASTSNTPAMPPNTLKRKQASDTSSAPISDTSSAPPAKRVTRKRGRTTGGG